MRIANRRVWNWLLIGTVALAAALTRFVPRVRPTPLRPPTISYDTPKSVSVWPLIATICGIVAIAALWISGQAIMAASDNDALARALTGGDPARAGALVTRYGCGGCHTIRGIPGAEGRVAAPLSGLRERVYIAGRLPNTADNLIRWIVAPEAVTPDSAMPTSGISPAEARDVAAYLYGH
jgi:mono/diheme cytochrome c family protein